MERGRVMSRLRKTGGGLKRRESTKVRQVSLYIGVSLSSFGLVISQPFFPPLSPSPRGSRPTTAPVPFDVLRGRAGGGGKGRRVKNPLDTIVKREPLSQDMPPLTNSLFVGPQEEEGEGVKFFWVTSSSSFIRLFFFSKWTRE